ncbi:MAG: inositol-3-phosphate synthase [Elusimicrobiota bacterium]
MNKHDSRIPPANGKLAVLLPGMGAVTSTFIAGVELIKKGLGKPVGSITQMQAIRLGKRYENRSPLIKDFVPLASLDQLVFGGWDLFTDDMFVAATKAGVLDAATLTPVAKELAAIKPMSPVYDPAYVKNLKAAAPKKGKTKWDLAQQVIADIESFKKKHGCERAVMLWCGSTEVLPPNAQCHEDAESFERGLKNNDPAIPPSMIYAYAAIMTKTAYGNGAPNLSADTPAMVELSEAFGVPVCGKDFKTGQTLMKTTIAPMLKARMLALTGWYSTNILGNRDGEVLDDPGSFKTKEKSKMSVLDTILEPGLYPDLYGSFHHKVRIDYYPPRGDAKEGWDNIDIRGWLDMPMQVKINFLCRDSILAAPIVLDLVLFLDLAQRVGLKGIQEWLSFFFKSPQCRADLKPEHDLFIQHLKLKNTLRILMGEEVLDHSGLDYYDAKKGVVVPSSAPKPAAKRGKLTKAGR